MDKLFYYSRSADKPVGKGANEVAHIPKDYQELNKIKDWRRVLSNFHKCLFRYEGRTYLTIEHAFQAAKIAIVDAEKAALFSIESGSELSKGGGEMARKNRKMLVLNSEQLSKWNKQSGDIMLEITIAKIKVCTILWDVLRLTLNAELWHIRPRQTPIRSFHLEKIRKNIQVEEGV